MTMTVLYRPYFSWKVLLPIVSALSVKREI